MPSPQKMSNQEALNHYYFHEVILCGVSRSRAYFQIIGRMIYCLQFNERARTFNPYKRNRSLHCHLSFMHG